jgi:hypothetical protein
VSVASTLELLEEYEDEMIWQFHALGVYSTSSLYSIINFRVTPVYIPIVWDLITPLGCSYFSGWS